MSTPDDMSTGGQECLWTPGEQRKQSTHVEQFRHRVNQRHDLELADFSQLHRWSVLERGVGLR